MSLASVVLALAPAVAARVRTSQRSKRELALEAEVSELKAELGHLRLEGDLLRQLAHWLAQDQAQAALAQQQSQPAAAAACQQQAMQNAQNAYLQMLSDQRPGWRWAGGPLPDCAPGRARFLSQPDPPYDG